MAMLSSQRLTYLLELDGKLAGRFLTSSGGGAHADVIVEKVGGGQISRKHLGAARYQDIGIECATGMSRTFYDWVGSAFGGATIRKTGAVIALDMNSKPKNRLDFKGAFVTSLVLPNLNRSATEGATMTVTLSPEWTSYKPSSEALDLGVYAAASAKAWSIGSFRIQIDDLGKECSHVTRISSLTLGKKIAQDAIGETRDISARVPGAIEFSNIALTLPGSFADGFRKWLDDSVVKGNTSEKGGSIDFFAPGSSSPYFSVKLGGLGIYDMPSLGGNAKDALPVTVNLYCEEMTFSAGAAAIK